MLRPKGAATRPLASIALVTYMVLLIDARSGRNPFAAWFDVLDPQAAAKVTIAMARLEQGNLSNTKSVGGGVLEYRLDFGPGYRIYFGRDGDDLIILLCGGTKQRQRQDILRAQAHWSDYKRRRKEEA
jgi:putative addiction module killer protein